MQYTSRFLRLSTLSFPQKKSLERFLWNIYREIYAYAITKEIAFEIGASLTTIHENKTNGFVYLNRNLELSSTPIQHFKKKFQEESKSAKITFQKK